MSTGSMSRSDVKIVKWMIHSWQNGHIYGSPKLSHWYVGSLGRSLFYDWGGRSDGISLHPAFEIVLVRKDGDGQL